MARPGAFSRPSRKGNSPFGKGFGRRGVGRSTGASLGGGMGGGFRGVKKSQSFRTTMSVDIPHKSVRFASGQLIWVSLCVILMILSRTNIDPIRQFRAFGLDTITPVFSFLTWPSEATLDIKTVLQNHINLQQQNGDLRKENAELLGWREASLQMDAENKRLKALLEYQFPVPDRKVTTRVVADSSSGYAKSFLLPVGTKQGVKPDDPVVNDAGLVGRILDVADRSSRLVLITDASSRIPVMIVDKDGKTEALAVAFGQNEPFLELQYAPDDFTPTVGSRVYTTGHGGVFPPDIFIGFVIAVAADKKVMIRPVLVEASVDLVQILGYDRPLPPKSMAQIPEQPLAYGPVIPDGIDIQSTVIDPFNGNPVSESAAQ